MIKKIIVLIGILACLSVVGCSKINKVEENNNNNQMEENCVDIATLDKEYNEIIYFAEELAKMIEIAEAEGELDMPRAIEILEYAQKNRVKPTQELTIALDKQFDELIELTIKYYLASESERPEIEARVIEVLETMDSISLEIERIIEEYNEII